MRAGTIHAIVGENGAGKSTLMKTLYGAHSPTRATIVVNGVEQHFRSPATPSKLGIGMVFQHFMLADNFTVWENIVLGDEPGTLGSSTSARPAGEIRELAARYGLDVDPDELVADLGVGEKQRVEILKVLYRGAPHHHPRRADRRAGAPRGRRAVRVAARAHRARRDGDLHLPQARRGAADADAITVIRAGRTVGEVADPSTVTARQLAEMMVGSELPSPETRRADRPPERGRARPRRTSTSGADGAAAPRSTDVALEVHAGEIVGIAGVEGNGQTELIDAIVGHRRPSTGKIVLDGTDIGKLAPATVASRASATSLRTAIATAWC